MNKDLRNVGIAAVVGLAAGYALGILTAPKSGKETREDIKEMSTKAYKAAEARLKDTYEDLGEAIDRASKQAKKLGDKGREQLDELVAVAKNAQARVMKLAASARNEEGSQEVFEDAVKEARDAKNELQEFMDNK